MPITFAETPLYYKDDQGNYHRILSGADMTGYRTASAQDVIDTAQDMDIANRAKTNMLGIVIEGNNTPVGANIGQYVIVKNSTISGITDGLYTAAQAIPQNTAIDDTYLTAVNNGGFNSLLGAFVVESGSNTNGYYTKFADGTLVQWKHYYNMSLSIAANSTAIKALIFPVSFVDKNYTVLVNPFGTTVPAERNACASSISDKYWVNICFQNKRAEAWSAAINFIAIGRWK